jgi:hypothetical protein
MTGEAPRLRPYQRDVVDRIGVEVAAGRRRILIVSPTGSGKLPPHQCRSSGTVRRLIDDRQLASPGRAVRRCVPKMEIFPNARFRSDRRALRR